MTFYNILFIAISGLLFGSFINVLIYRIPNNIDTILKPSFCPDCKNKIKFYNNIPILSYIYLKARCPDCKNKISPIYPIIEITVSLIFVAVSLKFYIFLDILLVSLLLSLFFALAVIDYKHKAIPDKISLFTLLIGFVISIKFDTFLDIFVISGFFIILKFYVSFVVKKEAMGDGDIIIAGIIGSLLGIKLAFIAIFISSVIAIIPSIMARLSKTESIPFIPYLFVGTTIALFLDKQIYIILKIIS